MLDDLRRPSSPRPRVGAPRVLVAAALAALLTACVSAREERAALLEVGDVVRDGTMQEDSLDELLEHIRALRETGPRDATALASIVALLRVVVESPAQFARAEALRAAWVLAGERPVPAFHEDDVDLMESRERTARYEALTADPARPPDQELRELIDVMASTRYPVARLELAFGLADLVVKQSLWGATPELRAAFEPHAETSALHALTAATLAASTEASAFLRQTAVEQAPHLPTLLGLQLIGNAFDDDPETLVALAAMGSLERMADRASDEQLAVLLQLARRRDEPALSERAERLERTPTEASQL